MQHPSFTIKQIHTDGSVSLYPATQVRSVPMPNRGNPPRGIAHTPCRIEFDMGDETGIRGSINSGVVYVLNQSGKTVDTFHFPFADLDQDQPAS